MKILFLGDLVSPKAIQAAETMIRKIRREKSIDIVIANAENVHSRNGLKREQFDALRMAGIDVVTLGNHAWDNDKIYDFIDDHPMLVRPFNFPPGSPGQGVYITDAAHRQLAVVVAMGNIYVSTLPSPFLGIDAILEELENEGVRHIIVEIHAEASAEKTAFAHYLDGRVSAVLGTHTHVPTADERILPGGTAFQTDVGMTGPYHSVIGMDADLSMKRFLTQRRVRYEQAETDDYIFNAVYLELNDSGQATYIERIQERLQGIK